MTATPWKRELESARVCVRRAGEPEATGTCVLYWMQHAQRALDNPALNLAIRLGNELGKPVAVFFGLTDGYPGANLRHYQFLLEGLAETRDDLARRGTPLVLLRVSPEVGVVQVARALRACAVVGDENPVRIGQRWRVKAAEGLSVPFYTVDADVIVPSALFPKEEYAARTIRPKIQRVLADWLVAPGNPEPQVKWKRTDKNVCPTGFLAVQDPVGQTFLAVQDPLALLPDLKVDRSVEPSPKYRGGPSPARALLRRFLDRRLEHYDEQRNHPDVEGTSELSAYLHFGQIGIHTVALAVQAITGSGSDAYLEELIVRREVAINFCLRNPHYDSLLGCPDWARATLAKHASDPRPIVYTEQQLEAAQSHDELWNAGQREMTSTGRMHGYVRMYWAKKILEWTRSPDEAFDIALRLNDKYELDGRDPNGCTGIAWAIGGKHDRPWGPERPIFGLIRYMSFGSTGKKFDWRAYSARV